MCDCNADKVYHENEATQVCTQCGNVEKYQHTDVSMTKSYTYCDHMIQNRERYTYKRITHFRQWLDKLQGKDHIPHDVIEKIRGALAQLPFTEQVSNYRMRQILKETGCNAYFNSIPAIKKIIYKIEPPTLTPTERLEVESLFKEIDATFAKHIYISRNRRNMLSYAYVLSKILDLLQIQNRFTDLKPLKHADKIRDANEMWEVICDDLGVAFK